MKPHFLGWSRGFRCDIKSYWGSPERQSFEYPFRTNRSVEDNCSGYEFGEWMILVCRRRKLKFIIGQAPKTGWVVSGHPTKASNMKFRFPLRLLKARVRRVAGKIYFLLFSRKPKAGMYGGWIFMGYNICKIISEKTFVLVTENFLNRGDFSCSRVAF